MRVIEKTFGGEVTTRTWETLERGSQIAMRRCNINAG